MSQIKIKGRAAGFDPPSRFEKLYVDYNPEDIAEYFDIDLERKIPTTFYIDTSKSILAKNDSPDLFFDYSINPYRGCEHGCIYCYARPSHEYLGFSSGIDFETKIMVKMDASELLGKTFRDKKWKPQIIVLSGNTDCYQPAEKKLQLTRKCLEVFLKYKNPVGIITKNALIQRDIDILKELASLNLAAVTISITSLNQELTKKMEPRTSAPYKRLETIEALANAGIPVGVNVAPVIPGLTDEEIPKILKAASERGAISAAMIMLRLPFAVKDLFIEWLKRNYPEKVSRVLNRIRDTRGGKLNEAEFGKRMSGEGEIAESIRQLFDASCRKYGLNKERNKLSTTLFSRGDEIQTEMEFPD